LEKRHDQGKALTILAPKLARAVYDMLKRKTACEMNIVLHTSGSRAGAPGASLDTQGDKPAWSVLSGLLACVVERDGTPRPCLPEPYPLIGHPLWLLESR
jgi:hypothetical protein